MRLHEHQAKHLLLAHGIAVPRGEVASTPEAAQRNARSLGYPVAVKAQVLVGGRGKAGGVRIARTDTEVAKATTDLLSGRVRGALASSVLVEEAVSIARELYIGVTLDGAQQMPVLISSPIGGIDIESIATTEPNAVYRAAVRPCIGVPVYVTRAAAAHAGLTDEPARAYQETLRTLYAAFIALDATLVEINPLAITAEGALIALDAKIIVDDNSLYRHPDVIAEWGGEPEGVARHEARDAGLSFVELDGDVGCLVNGAGLAMATMDILQMLGGRAANFLDIGGGADSDRVATALQIILRDTQIKALLLNVFGGITRCDEVANGLLHALQGVSTDVPVIVRLAGTNEEEGRRILESSGSGIVLAKTLTEAARLAIDAARQDRALRVVG
ncbi:MAG: ADP-forming succinate--CoA ligase subunit beta [Chloroflexi bacterium]|nr:ADP-forming succinate--CoA ligase subunit beta [Chloroflexota bacterium]